MLNRYTQREYDRKVAAMSPECKVRRSVRQGAERDKAARDSAPTLQAVRPFDWERDTYWPNYGFENGAGI